MSNSGFFLLIREDLSRLSEQSPDGLLVVRYRNLVHPRFIPVLIVRLAQWCNAYGLLRPIAVLLTWMNVVLFGIEVAPRCKIGGGLFLPHTSGTVIGAASIGRNATIFQGVTLGAKYADMSYVQTSRPVLEDNVVIGAGAKVLGGIVIGVGACVAANSLVLQSVPSGAVAIGVPAVIKERQ